MAGKAVAIKNRHQTNRYNELKAMLLESRQEIVGELGGQRENLRHELLPDKSDQAAENSKDDVEFEIAQMRSGTLAKIDEALRRLEANEFGYCRNCGEEIEEKRLKALLFATLCLKCEEAREIAEQTKRQAERHQLRIR